ncbi:MAG: CHAT domain-containing protein, partial [Bacteroidetes bacterium]|nr:CHAT domain-containing protein [Bacteroidota bacterium]
LYYLSGDFIHAIQYAKKGLNVIYTNAGNPAISKHNLSRYYYYLSIFYDSLNQHTLRNKAADSCIANEIRLNGDFKYIFFLLDRRVQDFFFEGDYHSCINLAELGETIVRRSYRYDDSLDFVLYFIYYKVKALYALKKFSTAEDFLKSKKAELKRNKNKKFVGGSIYNLYGYLSEAKKDTESAVANFLNAFKYEQKNKEREINAEALMQLGIIYTKEPSEKKTALRYFFKALNYAKAPDSVMILAAIGNAYAKINLFDSAHIFFNLAFDKIKPGLDENGLNAHLEDYLSTNTALYIVQMVLDKADAYFDQYRIQSTTAPLHHALRIYKAADQLLNNIKSRQSELASKLFWRNYTRRLYEHAIIVADLLHDNEDVFYFFEKSRAVLLNDQVNQLSKISNDDILRKAQLERKISKLKKIGDTLHASSSEYVDNQKSLIIARQEQNLIEQTIRSKNPLYYQSFLDTTFIKLKDIQQNLLNQQTALLEFFNGDSAVYSIFITEKNVVINKINKEGFETKVNTHISYLSDPEMLNKNFTGFMKNANELYELIFKNIPLSIGRIIISPDGKYFPFETLVTNTITSTPVYFLNDHITSYTYSARYLLNDFSHDSVSISGNFLGVAPVQFPQQFHLASLNESDRSLNTIVSYFSNTKNFVQQQASKNNFLQKFYGYKIIQLYTHSSDSSSNGEPVIYFADSALYLSDLIAEAKPATQLIVLSACETGNGKLYQGEGVFSFNRGFAALGIPSSVTNLWSVDNESTYKLTEFFYKYVTKGLPLDEALQKAKLEFIQTSSKEKSLPYYWAASILAGKTDAIKLKKGQPWKYFTGAIVLLGIFVLGSHIKKRKKMAYVR